MKILTEQRSTDWIAYLENKKQYWGCGSSETEAIIDLIITLRTYDNLCINVTFDR